MSYSSNNINHIAQPCIYGRVVVSSYTERKSRFTKWLSKIFIGGAKNSRVSARRRQPQFLAGDRDIICHNPVRFQDDRTRTGREKEELDRAVALSLSEDIKRPNGHRWRMDNDKDLSIMSLGDAAPYVPRDNIYHRAGYRTCGGCKHEIGYGNYLRSMGMFFHPECFRCHACGYPITEHEFSLSGRDKYHKSCFREIHHPRCEVCHEFIPVNGDGLIEYRCHPFWSQKYCPCHEHDGIPRCCSCERLESTWKAKHVSLGDGRSLCLECMESAMVETGESQTLYHSIRDYYEGLNMRIDQQIPMLLVERQALNEAQKHGFHHMPETRGLCLSEEQTVTCKRPRMEEHSSGLIGMRTQPHNNNKLISKCEVTAILALYGLPRLLTGAILAHELMHGWLRLNGYRNLRPEVEEGICQVLSYMWLESEVVLPLSRWPAATSSSSSSKKGVKSSVENKLGEFFMHQIAHDASPAYGGGYRTAMAAVNKYGLRPTLDHIRYTSTFPE